VGCGGAIFVGRNLIEDGSVSAIIHIGSTACTEWKARRCVYHNVFITSVPCTLYRSHIHVPNGYSVSRTPLATYYLTHDIAVTKSDDYLVNIRSDYKYLMFVSGSIGYRASLDSSRGKDNRLSFEGCSIVSSVLLTLLYCLVEQYRLSIYSREATS